jgi:hypothetical protein
MDLTMEYNSITKDIQIKSEWVRGHQDKEMTWDTIPDLQNLQLSNTAKLKILCDKYASDAQKIFISDPEGDILPSEKWVVYTTAPSSRKITGKLKDAILQDTAP